VHKISVSLRGHCTVM